jgi:type II secretory pathway pseudopilin PulG
MVVLIVVAIIAILALAVFVAIDPLKRFADSRDSVRSSDVVELLSAIKLYQIDNGGEHLAEIDSLTDGNVYMIVDGNMDEGCDDNNLVCTNDELSASEDVTADTDCVDLSGLVTAGYLGQVPVSPSSQVSWDDGSADGENGTGYLLEKQSTGIVSIRACEAEQAGTKIESSR